MPLACKRRFIIFEVLTNTKTLRNSPCQLNVWAIHSDNNAKNIDFDSLLIIYLLIFNY